MALVDGDVRLDCPTLYAQATTLAHALHARMPPGSVVSFMLPNWHEAAVIYLAATLAGMVVNPILPSLRDRELQFILEDADSRMIFIPADFGSHDYAAMLSRVTAAAGLAAGGRGGARRFRRAHIALRVAARPEPVPAALPALDPDAVRMILYTSGTTGRPKGVLHSHNSIHALIRQIRDHWLSSPATPSWSRRRSPTSAVRSTRSNARCCWARTAVLMDRWNADEAVALMRPRALHAHGRAPRRSWSSCSPPPSAPVRRLPDLKVFVCGGAPCRRR